jgi:hypothetical protein
MRTPRFLLGLSVAVTLAGCGDATDLDLRAEASKSFTDQVDAAGESGLRLEGINGIVTIHGDPASDLVRVSAELTVRSESEADAEQFLDRVWIDVSQPGGEVVVRTIQPSQTDGRSVVADYELSVPADLDVVVSNVNGEVGVWSVDGAVRVDVVNGAVTSVGISDDLDVTLVNGKIDASVTVPPSGFVDLSVVNGDVSLDIPASTSAMLEADVANGTIRLVGLMILDASTSMTSVRGRLGAGDGLIDLGAVNGNITVRGR